MTVPDTKIPLTSQTPLDARLQALETLIPEAFSEGRIDFDKLRSALGDVVETSPERYGLSWAGKTEAVRAVQIPSKGTLEPFPEASVNFEGSQNMIIEGDNLEALKLLQKSYYGKVKMIYIDPPYNTGNEFIYPDNFREGLEDYLLYTGQRDAEGMRTSTQEDRAGRKHSKWMTMMYPRLFLARNLLREDGVIFISIDDNEVKNLRALMDEVFGEENFIATLIWQKKYAKQSDATWFSTSHDYVLLFARNSESWRPNRLSRNESQLKNYKNLDGDTRGPWQSVVYTCAKTRAERPNLYYPITHPRTGEEIYPSETRVWGYEKKLHEKHVKEGRIWWGQEQEKDKPRLKVFLNEVGDGVVPDTLWLRTEVGDTQEGKRAILELFNDAVFDTAKPSKLVKRMLEVASEPSKQDIVLDFFAGSGTTAQAVLDLNEEDGGNRRFILVQLPERIDRTDYPTIADITRERVRRVIAKLDKADEGKLELTERPDRGFKAFRLTESNFKVWNAEGVTDKAALTQQLTLFADNLREESSDESILYELILKAGFPLTATVERLSLEGGTVYKVDGGNLVICLERQLRPETLRAIIETAPKRVLCLDAGFAGNDQLKTNTVLEMRDAGIEFHTA